MYLVSEMRATCKNRADVSGDGAGSSTSTDGNDANMSEPPDVTIADIRGKTLTRRFFAKRLHHFLGLKGAY